MKVLQVIPDLRKGGAERITLDICNELMRKGAEVLLLNFRPENHYSFLTEKIKRQVVPARFVPSVTKKPLAELEGYKAAVLQFQPDVIHSHLFEAEIVTRQVIVPGVKYITHLHSNMEQLNKFSARTLTSKSSIINYVERKLLLKQYRKCANNFIAISNDTKEYYDRMLPGDLKRLRVMYNAIDYNRFFTPHKKTLDNKAAKLITVGSLVPRKNQEFLVKVAQRLHEEGYPIHLDILGEGPCRKKIEAQIRACGLQQYITLQGNVERVEEYLHRADIYVHSATYEPFGLSPVEAMAAGLPCVMLDAMGNRDIADEGRNCFLIPQGNENAFGAALKKIINFPARYSEMSEYARSYASKFDIAPYTERLLKFYASCAKAPA